MNRMLHLAALFLVFQFPGIAPAASPFDDSQTAVTKQASPRTSASAPVVLPEGMKEALEFNQARALANVYKPIGDWTGNLILPKPDQRRPDGSVFIKVTNSPDAALIGKTLRLGVKPGSEFASWFDQVRMDVTIAPKTLASTQKSGRRIPAGLNGWKAVSPLESLVAARPAEMSVVLAQPAFDGENLLVESEPVQISGSRKALVKFVGPAKGDYRKVIHFDPKTGTFSGAQEFVAIPPTCFRTVEETVPISDTTALESSAANDDGWYIFGTRAQSIFQVEALEPRAALRLTPGDTVSGKQAIKTFLAEKQFGGLVPDLARTTALIPESADAPSWQEGSRGLLVHLFGWRKTPLEKKQTGVLLGLVTGHFAFGIAEVVRCPFTGELRWDLDYFQVYTHNVGWLVSCSQKWHAYMGNLRRGWMYTIPVSDTVVRLPADGLIEWESRTFDFFEALRREFGTMMAVYRTGAGKGIISVRTDISCVQDSHCAFYATLRECESFFRQAGENLENATGTKISELVKHIMSNITFHGLASGKWREFYGKPASQRYANIFTIALDSMLSAGTIFPRNANDRMIEMMAERGLPMFNILTCEIGGRPGQWTPLAPTSPRRR